MWLEEMVDEFTEDPHCHFVLVGADDTTVMFLSLWSEGVADEVAASMASMAPQAHVRKLTVSVPVPAS